MALSLHFDLRLQTKSLPLRALRPRELRLLNSSGIKPPANIHLPIFAKQGNSQDARNTRNAVIHKTDD